MSEIQYAAHGCVSTMCSNVLSQVNLKIKLSMNENKLTSGIGFNHTVNLQTYFSNLEKNIIHINYQDKFRKLRMALSASRAPPLVLLFLLIFFVN